MTCSTDEFIRKLQQSAPWLQRAGGGRFWARTPTRALAIDVEPHAVYVQFQGDWTKIIPHLLELCQNNERDLHLFDEKGKDDHQLELDFSRGDRV